MSVLDFENVAKPVLLATVHSNELLFGVIMVMTDVDEQEQRGTRIE
jgi:hypothetical protein